MKKILCMLLTLVLALGIALPANAAPTVSVYVNGEKLVTDQAPIIIGGRTMVPLRAIFESLGSEIYWNGETRTCIATDPVGDKAVILSVGEKLAMVSDLSSFLQHSNDSEADFERFFVSNLVTLDVPATIVNNRILVPLRFVGESLGCEVGWNGTTRRVDVNR